MIKINKPDDISDNTPNELQSIINRRLDEFDSEFFGILVEAGDTISSLESVCLCPIISNPINDSIYGDEDFVPLSEFIEDHGVCYEMVFIFSDDDAGTTLFIPKSSGIDPVLLSLCAKFCVSSL